MNGKWCRDKNDMSEHQLRRLRGFRQVSKKRMGINRLTIEPISIFDINGKQLQAVGEFKYLGTIVTNCGGATKEVRSNTQNSFICICDDKFKTCVEFIYSSNSTQTSPVFSNYHIYFVVQQRIVKRYSQWYSSLGRLLLSVSASDYSFCSLQRSSWDRDWQSKHWGCFPGCQCSDFGENFKAKETTLARTPDPFGSGGPSPNLPLRRSEFWFSLVEAHLSDLREIGIASFRTAEVAALDRASWRNASCARPGHWVLRLVKVQGTHTLHMVWPCYHLQQSIRTQSSERV